MFQSFATTSDKSLAAERVSALRGEMRRENLDGFLVPRADKYQGQNVAACDERLAWLTGFTGSAGTCVVLENQAALFVDGRYILAVRGMIDLGLFQPLQIPDNKISDWLIAALPQGGTIGFDPWLHTSQNIADFAGTLAKHNFSLRPAANLIDGIWHDRLAPPLGKIRAHPLEYAGETHQAKRARLAATLQCEGTRAAIITAADSVAWLLNIRGSDIARTPVPHCLAILHDDGKVALFVEPEKSASDTRAHLGNEVELRSPSDFGPSLDRLSGPVGLDEKTTPIWVADRLKAAGIMAQSAADPCILPMTRKNAVELAGARKAHLRDGAAMANFLHWLDSEALHEPLTEIGVVKKLEHFRRETGLLQDISFDTICGSGPNGAIVHYRVTEETNRAINQGDVLLVDSGAQYLDGTTDITRTIAIGAVNPDAARAFTLVLKGMIAISLARWPIGLSGRDLDAFARQALWQAGLDYDHGTGHGVGSYLDVHEGPQGISRRTTTPLEAGMMLSNEPGYYREGAFGIRIENLVVVEPASIPKGGERLMHSFETLTLAPIDRSMIVTEMLGQPERDWLDAYHARVLNELSPLVPMATRQWLTRACAPI